MAYFFTLKKYSTGRVQNDLMLHIFIELKKVFHAKTILSYRPQSQLSR
jgi:hypothetical protein